VLVTLSDRAQSAGVGEAAADYAEAQKTYEACAAAGDEAAGRGTQLDVQRAARDAARAAWRRRRRPWATASWSRPSPLCSACAGQPRFAGDAGTVITTLDDVSKIELDFSVPERSLGALAWAGDPRQQRYLAGGSVRGRITSIGSRVDAATRALSARAEFENPQRRCGPGMLLEVELSQARGQVLQVPELSLQQLGEQAFVFRAAGDKVELVPVKIGARRPGWVEILEA
jgi:membrane fusion protein (multidrug efflux system)